MLPMTEPAEAPQDLSPGREAFYVVTDKVLSVLEAGTVPWSRRGDAATHRAPHNAERGNRYNVFNSLVLSLAMEERGYAHSGWLTVGQVEKLGATVQAGQDPTNIILFFSRYQKAPSIAAGEAKSSRKRVAEEEGSVVRRHGGSGLPAMRPLPLYNVDQVSGLPKSFFDERLDGSHDSHARALSLVTAVGARVTPGLTGPTYDSAADEIVVPKNDKLTAASEYDARLLRQLARWAGHASRANWKIDPPPPQSGLTASESLETDLAAASLCTLLGVSCDERRQVAINYWRQLVVEDAGALLFSAVRAEKAVAFLDKVAGRSGWDNPKMVSLRREDASLILPEDLGAVLAPRSESAWRPEKRRPKAL